MPTVLTSEHFGKSVTVARGETLLLRLPENPSTGYAWHLLTEPVQGLEVMKDAYLSEPAQQRGRAEGFAGGGGVHEFLLHVTQPGTFLVLLRKSFGDEPEPDDREEQVRLVVQPQSGQVG